MMGKQELCVSDVTDICEVDCLECESTFVVYEENHNAQYHIIYGKKPTI